MVHSSTGSSSQGATVARRRFSGYNFGVAEQPPGGYHGRIGAHAPSTMGEYLCERADPETLLLPPP